MFTQPSAPDPTSIDATTLPICHYLWVGPPSDAPQEEYKVKGHDIDGVIQMAKCAKNPIHFYCLAEYQSYYEDTFRKLGIKNVTVKNFEEVIQNCYSAEDDDIRNQANVISQLFKVHKERGTRKSFVALKDFLSLLILYQGGYTLDTNVQPAHLKPMILPHHKDFYAPYYINIIFEIWMFYAPSKNPKVKKALLSSLNDWHLEYSQGYEKAHCHILDNVEQALGLKSRHSHTQDFYPRKWQFDDILDSQVRLQGLNLIKTYFNTHRSVAEKAKRIIAMVNEEKQIDEKIVLAPCDYKEMFKQTIKNRELEVVKYFSSINNMTQSLMTMILNNFLKAGAHVDFEEFYQQILTTLQIEKLAAELLIKELFIWSVQYHFNEYAILLINQKASSKNLGVFSEWTSVLGAFSDVPLFQAGDILENKQFLKNLCTENVIPIITTLAKNQRDDLLAAISMMQNDYEIALKYVIEKWDINSFLVLIKHPYYANIKMEGYETLLISANIHHCRMFEILLDHPNSKTIPMVIRAMLCDLSQGNKKITMHFKNLLLEEKKINPAEFSNLITTLIEWAMRLDHSTTYPNFLLNQLEKISKDAQEKISSIALNNNFQLFRRAKKFITLNGVSPFDSPTPKTERCDHMLKQLPSP